ncbi:MAG TPA: hypothetical protein VGD79_10430 [Thermoanaerobaculia bacterium]|jgi:hypothetical protein
MMTLRKELLNTGLTAEDAIARLKQVITPRGGLRELLSTEYTGNKRIERLEGVARGRTFEARPGWERGRRGLHLRLVVEVTGTEPAWVVVRHGISSFGLAMSGVSVLLAIVGATVAGLWWLGVLGVVLFVVSAWSIRRESRDVSAILKKALDAA